MNVGANMQSKQKAKRGRPNFVGNADDGGEQNGKRLKNVEVTQTQFVKNLAKAIEQLLQEP